MLKILKFSKKSWPSIVLILFLLFIQANCDLALPEYTSNIVDIGIQNAGIESAVPEVMTEDTMGKILLFLSEEEQDIINRFYQKIERGSLSQEEERKIQEKYPAFSEKNIYMLMQEGYSKSERQQMQDTLSKILTPVEGMLMMLFSDNMDGSSDTATMRGMVLASMGIPEDSTSDEVMAMLSNMSKEARVQMKNDMIENMGDVSELMLDSVAFAFVKSVYQEVGENLTDIQMNYLAKMGSQMLGLALLGMIVAVSVGLLASRMAARTSKDLRNQVFFKVVGFSNAEMNQFSTASLITRCTNDIQQVQMVTVMLFRMVAYAPIMGIGGIVKVMKTQTGMTWIIAVAVATIIFVVLVLMVIAMPKFKQMQKLVDRLNLVTREILTGVSVIRAFSREKHEEERFDVASKDLMRTQLFTNRAMTFMMPIMMLIMNTITVLIIWVGAHGIDFGQLQVGDMMAFITYTMQIVMSFLMITMVSVMLPRAAVAAGRVDEVLKSEAKITNPKHPKKAEGKGEVAFHHVDFAYPKASENVLIDIDFVAKPGETTAIIGSTGCGKSTIVQLIPRLFDVTKGSITIDGVDVRDMDRKELREQIGYVPQKGILFSGTIESNLKFGKSDASEEDLKEAAQIAQATEFIETKPEHYKTEIAQGGTNVSGGQKQRLSIARAIIKKPKIYIFDDSFSALDFKTDAALRKALKEQVSNATVLIVAQRISTILHAETILVVDDGKIVGKGTHEELLRENEVYQQIAMSQLSKSDMEKIGG